eukprot:g33581.t1
MMIVIFPVIVFSSQYLTYSAVPLHQILLVTLSFFSAQIRVRRSTAAHEATRNRTVLLPRKGATVRVKARIKPATVELRPFHKELPKSNDWS